MHIGKLYFGYRDHDSHLWKRYLLPKAYNSDRKHKHEYFKFYYRWLNFYWCMPRKCDQCGRYVDSNGGHHIWDTTGEHIIITVCNNCYYSKTYTDREGRKYYAYLAWLKEQRDKEMLNKEMQYGN